MALDIGLNDYRKYLRRSFEAMIAEGLSVVAIDQDNEEVIGCLIVSDFHRHISPSFNGDSKFAPLAALTSELCAQYQLYRSINSGEAILVDMGAMSSNASGKGIYQQMRSFVQENAKQLGFKSDISKADMVFWGIPYDLSVTNRPGTRFGPRGIRAAATNLSWEGGPWPWGFDPFETLNAVDYGDCYFDPGHPMEILDAIYKEASDILAHDPFLISMGGDHSVAYPLVKAHSEKHGPVALIQIDAHSDTWEEGEKRIDHGTMFYHAAKEGLIDTEHSIQLGMRTSNAKTHGFNVFDANWIHLNGVLATIEKIKEIVGDRPAYLTFDIDALDPAFAPGTGTPVCGGLSTWQAQTIVRGLIDVDIVGMDLVEVSPPYDHAEITALAAASLLLDFVCLRKARLDHIADK
ncbi:Agmatinase [Nymphon striatum]|nr:Agmatinase [Nymphon striatum]